MKMPNGYGTVVKMSGGRRKPYGVRITVVERDQNGIPHHKKKWVGFFETQKEALIFQASLSPDMSLPDMKKYQVTPTFAELYDRWISAKKESVKGLSEAYEKNLDIAYRMLEPVHDKRITAIRPIELQEIISSYSSKSKTTLRNIGCVLKGVFEYAIMSGYLPQEKNPTRYLKYESNYHSVSIHRRFSDEEIKKLWNNLYVINNVDCVLIMIYTGMRPSEMLGILTANVHLDKQYMVGGMKTINGYNRLIPLCDKILCK